MRLDYAQRGANHFHPNARVIEQAACLFDQFLDTLDAKGTAVLHQFLGQPRKILHVRSENHGLASDDWFHRILAPTGGEAFADENNRRNRVPITQLTGGIEEKTVSWQRFHRRASADKAQTQLA